MTHAGENTVPVLEDAVAASQLSDGSIPFNRPYITGEESRNISDVIARGRLTADGAYSELCKQWLLDQTEAIGALLVHSCTAALELAMVLSDVGQGDEVILPSYTFTSTANAVALRGATCVFVDVRADTLNLDEQLVEAAITDRTKAIIPVHYAGVGCAMDVFEDLADRYGVSVIEDAAQGVLSTWQSRPLGSISRFGAMSFHETKNLTSGEGGVLLLTDPADVERAEIVREKGTNRSKFIRGEVDKYTWVDVGSSYAMSEINAAYLWAQLSAAHDIDARRHGVWDLYAEGLADLEAEGLLRLPRIPDDVTHNAHMFYVLMPTAAARDEMLDELRARGVRATFHYVPLDQAPAGQKYGRVAGPMDVTHDLSRRIVRLPLWAGMEPETVQYVIQCVRDIARPSN